MNRREFMGAAAITAAGFGRFPSVPARQRVAPPIDGERLNRRLAELARFGANADGGIDRVAYSDADVAAREYVKDLMRQAGLRVHVDTAANIIGRRDGSAGGLPPLMTGSHIDSVPGGGNYDGQVGSMAAIEVAQTLADRAVRTRHPLEVIIFQNEENGKVGSKAIRGEDPARYLELVSHSGRTIREGIRFIGGDPDRLDEARRRPGEIAAFIELHIEQGSILDRGGIDIGVVQGIVGIKRWAVTVEGFANHAGTTPMDQRRDALLAASRLVVAVNEVARSVPGRHVATVGVVEAEPGAPNVIAGTARLTLEIRDLELDTVDRLFAQMRTAAGRIASDTGTRFDFREIYRTQPAHTHERVRSVIEESASGLGLSALALPSGAGHDAQEMAQLAPMGMIFVPSRDGISHSPHEFSSPEDIVNGARVLLDTLLRLDATELQL